MPAGLPLESFWDLVKRSGVIAEEQLQPLWEEYKQNVSHLDTSDKVADDLVARELLTRWQADMLLKGRHKGFFLGPYRLLDLLGKGGMGSVYVGEHLLMRRRAAVKVLPSKQISRRPSMLERFRREAQAVAALDHLNIVRAYEFNKELLDKVDVYYLAMELVEGEDLQQLVAERKANKRFLDFFLAVDYIRQAALGLAHAHEAGLVHRDIKPANLFIDDKGVVKILDLGLVKSFEEPEDSSSLTGEHENTVLGTADYLAPEQAVSSRDVDARADIYALGHTLYYAITGHPPFPKGTIQQRIMAHQSRHAESVFKTRSDTPPDLVKIIDKMVAKKASHRYQTANQVAEALSDWLFENAPDEWILEHPGLRGNRSDSSLLSGHDLNLDTAELSGDNELDLMPLGDEKSQKGATEKKSQTESRPDKKTKVKKKIKRKVPPADRAKSPKGATVLSGGVLPMLEGDPNTALLEIEPASNASRELRPIRQLGSLWSITGLAQRLQVPSFVLAIAMVLLIVLVLAMAALVFSQI